MIKINDKLLNNRKEHIIMDNGEDIVIKILSIANKYLEYEEKTTIIQFLENDMGVLMHQGV